MSEMIQAPIAEFKSRPQPANLPFWIQCFLHHHKDRNVPRSEIIEAALTRHYSRDQIFEALRYLDKDLQMVHIACFWDRDTRTEYWRWCDMTVEEHAKHVDDNMWFESLPEYKKV